MQNTKEVVVKNLQGQDITILIKTIVSEYDMEQIDAVYIENMELNEDGTPNYASIKGKANKILVDRTNRILEVMITDWKGTNIPAKPTPENLKKSLTRAEYQKLMTEVEAIIEPQEVTPQKKTDLPKS